MQATSFSFAARSGGLAVAAFAFLAVIAFAQPTLTAPATSNLGAGQVTLALKSSAAGTGYFTLLEGSAPKLGTGAQTKAGKDGNGAAAARFGSLKLAANTAAGYTLGNLKAGTAYTICFTADDGATLQPTVATVGFATNASVNLEGAPWAVAGDRLTPGSNPGYTSVAFAPDGTPYVAFQNDSSDYRATVKQLVGGKWTQVGNADFSVSTASFLVLAFAPNGIPHVAYCDWADSYGRMTVMRLEGASWVEVGAPRFTTGQVESISLAFAPDGTPYVAYRDGNNNGQATVMKFNGSVWVFVGPAGFSPALSEGDLSLAIAPDGAPCVAYWKSDGTDQLVVMKYDGAGWSEFGGAGFPTARVWQTNLVYAPDGTMYVAYSLYSLGKANVICSRGAGWSVVGVAGFSTHGIHWPRLAIAPDGTAFIAFSAIDEEYIQRLVVERFNGRVWEELPSTVYTAPSHQFGIAINPDGIPYVVYTGAGNARVMRLEPPELTTYAAWVKARFTAAEQGDAAISGTFADPDGAGVTNFLRYACDLPARGSVPGPAKLATIADNGSSIPALQFRRRSNAPGLKYEVQASADLAAWTPVSSWTADASTTVIARDAVALGAAPRRFLRLLVTQP